MYCAMISFHCVVNNDPGVDKYTQEGLEVNSGFSQWLNTLCDEDRVTARLYDSVGITFFGHVVLKRHDCYISMIEVLLS